MGIDLRWEDEKGEHLTELPDRGCHVARILPDFESSDFLCLSFVDPAGDAVFNQPQIAQVVWELESLQPGTMSRKSRCICRLFLSLSGRRSARLTLTSSSREIGCVITLVFPT